MLSGFTPPYTPSGRSSLVPAPPWYYAGQVKLYRRTNDPIWLDCAREFAMTAIVQYRGSQIVVSHGRYSLWTGDVGLAIYLWDCITGEPRFPTIDVF